MILKITDVRAVGGIQIHVRFNDGSEKVVDLASLLDGPIFEPLRDPKRFAEVRLDVACGTVAWPNGADLAPEAIHGLDPVVRASAS